MTFKPPFTFDEMMKMFEPASVAKMFDPQNMMAIFEAQKPKGLDLGAVMESNKRNFEAMQAANQAAAAANKDFYEKQMEIFKEITKGAHAQMQSLESSSGADFAEKQDQIYRAAVEKSLAIMTELADATRRANEEASAAIKDRVNDAINELGDM